LESFASDKTAGERYPSVSVKIHVEGNNVSSSFDHSDRDWKPWRKTNSAPQEMDPDLEYQNARIAFVSQNLSPDPAEEEIAD
jgi:hypothetical protein